MGKINKILIINSVYGIGSTGRMCFDVAKTFADNGYDVMVGFGRKKSKALPIKNVKECYIGGIINLFCHFLKTRFFDRHGFGSFFATKSFIKKVEAFGPDVIWINNLHGYYINIKYLFNWIKKRNVKVIWTLHDCWPFTGHCSHFIYAKCERWKNGCFACPEKRRYPQSYFIDKSKINYQAKKDLFTGIENMILITPSDWLNNIVKQSFLKHYLTKTINNGIDLNIFSKKEKNTVPFGPNSLFDKSNRYILCIANYWTERKGIYDIIELSHHLRDDERIILVGQFKNKISLPNNIIHFCNIENAEQLVCFYNYADVFFNPTYEDNYPTVNLEAISCFCPVVCYDTGGSCEMIDNRYSVPVGDYLFAYSLIESLFENSKNYDFTKRQKMSKTQMCKSYLELLKTNND